MKLFTAVVMASALALPGSVMAASSLTTLNVHVPFAFVMAGQEFAAGDYRVQENENGIICLQGSGKAAMALSVPASARPGAPSGLQFTSKEAREHLVGVQVDGTVRSLALTEDSERKLTVASVR